MHYKIILNTTMVGVACKRYLSRRENRIKEDCERHKKAYRGWYGTIMNGFRKMTEDDLNDLIMGKKWFGRPFHLYDSWYEQYANRSGYWAGSVQSLLDATKVTTSDSIELTDEMYDIIQYDFEIVKEAFESDV